MSARPIGKFLRAAFADQAHGLFNMSRVGIAVFDEAHGQAVSAEDEMNARAVGKLAQALADVGDERLDVKRVVEEVFDGALGERVCGRAVDAAPFFQATERGGVGIVRVKREKDKFIEAVGFFDGGDGVFGERLPVAHRGDGDGIEVRADSGDEFAALAFSEDGDGRAAADLAVTQSDGRSTFFGDIAGERAADEVKRAERDNVGVAEEVAEEGFHGGERVGAAELEEDDADAFFGLGSHGCFCDSLSLARLGG